MLPGSKEFLYGESGFKTLTCTATSCTTISPIRNFSMTRFTDCFVLKRSIPVVDKTRELELKQQMQTQLEEVVKSNGLMGPKSTTPPKVE